MSKKILSSILLLAVVGCCAADSKTSSVFSIDSSRLLRESQEGRGVLVANDKDKDALMRLEYEQTQKITKLRGQIEEGMRGGKLSENVLQEKYEELGRLQRKAKFAIEDAREEFEMQKQRRVISFRTKIHKVAAEFFNKAGGSMVFDKATPGIIFVADSTDRTDSLLKEIDTRYKKEQVQATITKANTKSA